MALTPWSQSYGWAQTEPPSKGTRGGLSDIFCPGTLYLGIKGTHIASPLVNVLPMERIKVNAWPMFGNVWALESMATAVSTEKEPWCKRS